VHSEIRTFLLHPTSFDGLQRSCRERSVRRIETGDKSTRKDTVA
jgi:hypothetical protein